jgi:hypothetical protein
MYNFFLEMVFLQGLDFSLSFLEFFFFFSFFFNFFSIFFFFICYTFIISIKFSNFLNKKKDIYLIFLKNLLKKFLLISFLLILFNFYLFINYNLSSLTIIDNTILQKNLLEGFVFSYKNFFFNINLYGFLILFISYFTGYITISVLNTVHIEQRIRLYIFFLIFIIIIFGFIQTTDLLLFFFFYELLLLGSFLIVFYSSYTKKAIQASIYFVI